MTHMQSGHLPSKKKKDFGLERFWRDFGLYLAQRRGMQFRCNVLHDLDVRIYTTRQLHVEMQCSKRCLLLELDS